MRPSAAATPSRAFKSPLSVRVLTSERFSLFRFLLLRLLEPLDDSSSLSDFESDFFFSLSLSLSLARETERVKAASRSSSRTMQREGTRPMRVVRVESFIQEDDKDTTYISSISSPARA